MCFSIFKRQIICQTQRTFSTLVARVWILKELGSTCDKLSNYILSPFTTCMNNAAASAQLFLFA
jgi:hypothetical protein